MPPSQQKLTFTNANNQALAARLEVPPDQHPIGYALFAHCFTCGKDLVAIRNISRTLAANGIAVLRFDFTGLGESEGDFADTNFSSNVDDLVATAEFMRSEYEAPVILIGHSLGGAAVLAAAPRIPSVKAVVTIGAPSQPGHVKHLLEGGIEEINRKGEAQIRIGGRPFTIRKQFLDDISEEHLRETTKNLEVSLLIMHSPQDRIVGINNAAEIYHNAMHPKSFISLDGADHLLTNKQDSRYVGNVIANWVDRYLPKRKDKDQPVRTDQKVAARVGKTGYTTEIIAGNHALTADEPESVGGNDFGPDPYGLLLASLGACSAMTLRMYADRKEWPLEEVTVHLNHEKTYAEDCEQSEQSDSRIDLIVKAIELEGDLDEQQRQRLLEIADRCPIHKTLAGEIRISSSLR